MKTNKNLELHDSSKPLLEKLKKLYTFAEKEMRGKSFKAKGDLRLVILLQLTVTTSTTVQSVLSQIDGKSFYGLDFLLRPLIEGLINYKYIKEDNTQMRARAFILDDIRSRIKATRRLVQLLENNEAPGMASITSAENYQQLVASLVQQQDELRTLYGEENLRFYDLETRARRSNTLELYATVYWVLCQDTHLTSRGLDRFIREVDNNIEISLNLELNRVNLAITTFYVVLAAFISECSEHFGVPNKNHFAKFEKSLESH